mmetsp:Transcript_3832/g.9693  ORF Transcript_3832/g.9693 Transcript_3832/m.9693 type:complete len:224 (+) Transcript_3832:213-884(+)|eukprot:CAMPEP_0168787060 /NCGR_PEP_ID=MMETSP0725-20121227/11601_1 /TAXON_ID=265536 /ORGANISM="Amphiprora sp., Strain CCMP467" /LENGTH=223 /DNA_ID=CAMNT_0008837245 /DNA_START=96 /DNA_END=767 /DNA_ORIENTATION=+
MSLTLSYNRHQSLSLLEHDVNVSLAEKTTALKLLSVICRNLQTSPDDPKFRQLRLANRKIQQLTRHAALLQYLQMTLGFVQNVDSETGDARLEIPPATTLDPQLLDEAVQQTRAIYQRLLQAGGGSNPKSLSHSTSSGVSSSSTSSTTPTEKLSEKQKARRLAEQRAQDEKRAAQESRKRTAAQIKVDKMVRQQDENWQPGVSAAAAKTGTGLQTFRDKYGES